MTAFEQAFALLKMPFVPGSVREGKLVPEDEEWKERQMYEADFYDPVDDKTRTIDIRPDRQPIQEAPARRSFFGGGPPARGKSAVAVMDLEEDELREPEKLFGMDQQVPFAYLHNKRTLDRLFVPEHLRRRGIGTGLVDALDEWKENFVPNKYRGDESIGVDSDNMQTEDMFRLWHSRGHIPHLVEPYNPEASIGDDQYYAAHWQNYGGPKWNEEGPDKRPFEEGWEEAHYNGQMKLLAEQEQSRLYAECNRKATALAEELGISDDDWWEEKLMQLPDVKDHHSDGLYVCECYEGHPWYAVPEQYSESVTSGGRSVTWYPSNVQDNIARHKAHGTDRYPGIWEKKRLNDELQARSDAGEDVAFIE